MNNLFRFCSFTLFALISTSAFAQSESDSKPDKYPGWIVGAGYTVAPNPFVGEADDASQAFPLIGYIGERFTWLGPFASYRFLGTESFSISGVAEYRFEGFDDDGNDVELAGLSKRTGSLETGFDVGYGPLEFSVRHDVSGRHNGASAALAATKQWDISKRLNIETGVSAQWQSSEIVNYYYGVDSTEVTVGRAFYSAGSAVNYGIDAQFTYLINRRSFVFASVDTRWLDNNITRSSIVNDNSQSSAFIGFAYKLFK